MVGFINDLVLNTICQIWRTDFSLHHRWTSDRFNDVKLHSLEAKLWKMHFYYMFFHLSVIFNSRVFESFLVSSISNAKVELFLLSIYFQMDWKTESTLALCLIFFIQMPYYSYWMLNLHSFWFLSSDMLNVAPHIWVCKRK